MHPGSGKPNVAVSTGLWTKMRNTAKPHLIPISLSLTIPALNLVYPYLNHASRNTHSLMTDLDRMIPLLKIFVLPYTLWYVFIVLSLIYLCVKDRPIYYRTLLAIDIGLAICYTVYHFYQTTVPRPPLDGSSNLFDPLLRFTYVMDRPFNCFPSIHVLTSILAMTGVCASGHAGRAIRRFSIGITLSIILSTLFIKQHVILDVAGAMVAAKFAYAASGYVQTIMKGSLTPWAKKRFFLSTTRRRSSSCSTFTSKTKAMRR